MPTPNVVIVGLGPGGLAAAIEAARKGYQVTGLEKREDYIRGQRLKLYSGTISYLEKLIVEHWTYLQSNSEFIRPKGSYQKFLEIKQNPDKTIETKDLERLLLAILTIYHDRVSIYNGEITHVDANSGKLIISLKTKRFPEKVTYLPGSTVFDFQHLVAADGAGRSTQKILFPGMADVPYQQQPYHQYHGVANFQLNDGSLKRASFQSLRIEHLPELRKLGWEHNWLPRFYIFPNNEKTKFYIASEVPSHYHSFNNEDKRAALKNWFGQLLSFSYSIDQRYFGVKETSKHESKVRMRVQMFQQSFSRAHITHAQSSFGNTHFFQIGDAVQTPNYNFGHGANDAINTAVAFGNSLGGAQLGYQVYSDVYRQHIASIYHQFDNNMMQEAARDSQNRVYDAMTIAPPQPQLWNPLQGFMPYQFFAPPIMGYALPASQSIPGQNFGLPSEIQAPIQTYSGLQLHHKSPPVIDSPSPRPDYPAPWPHTGIEIHTAHPEPEFNLPQEENELSGEEGDQYANEDLDSHHYSDEDSDLSNHQENQGHDADETVFGLTAEEQHDEQDEAAHTNTYIPELNILHRQLFTSYETQENAKGSNRLKNIKTIFLLLIKRHSESGLSEREAIRETLAHYAPADILQVFQGRFISHRVRDYVEAMLSKQEVTLIILLAKEQLELAKLPLTDSQYQVKLEKVKFLNLVKDEMRTTEAPNLIQAVKSAAKDQTINFPLVLQGYFSRTNYLVKSILGKNELDALIHSHPQGPTVRL